MGLTYKSSGVDIEKGDRFVDIIRQKLIPEHKKNIGLFGGLYDLGIMGYKHPLLVSSTDGVGTKLILAKEAKRYNTIGIDLVAMCINDIITLGAKPLFFLDYMATSELNLREASQIIDGIIEGCREAGCVLLGGETAEMPDVYKKGDYELAGFSVGVVEKEKVIDCSEIKAGDVLIGIHSSGIHSNGLSLARKALFEIKGYSFFQKHPILEKSFIDELLIPTRIYSRLVVELLEIIRVKGIAHITGGGLYDNIKRLIPPDFDISLNWESLSPQPIFRIIQGAGDIDIDEMRRVFNLGIGMVFIVEKGNIQKIINFLKQKGESPILIGEVIKPIE